VYKFVGNIKHRSGNGLAKYLVAKRPDLLQTEGKLIICTVKDNKKHSSKESQYCANEQKGQNPFKGTVAPV